MGVHAPNTLKVAPVVIVCTRLDERGEQAGTLRSGFSKSTNKPVLQKTRCTSAQFYAVLSEDFCAHKFLSLKFIQIVADDRETFV